VNSKSSQKLKQFFWQGRLPGTLYWIGLLLLAGAVVITVIGHMVKHGLQQPNWPLLFLDMYQSVGVQLASIAVTVMILDRLIQRRETRRDKERLIRQMGSKDNNLALQAVEELRAQGWLYDGSLQGAKLYGANLQKATLAGVNLQGANLFLAELQGSRLVGANLQETTLSGTNLREAELIFAELQGARLNGADLEDAILEATVFDEKTLLPDDTNWKTGADLTRFTDPSRPNFWRSSNPSSPAYRPSNGSNGSAANGHTPTL
jgi:membrane protein implicated in regulation of membrane protease activity